MVLMAELPAVMLAVVVVALGARVLQVERVRVVQALAG
jgi:hypothetical protein